MTYLIQDKSVDSGQPVELYVFQQGTQFWYYTSGPDVVTWTGVDYQPATVVRTDVTQSNEISKAGISLTFPRNHEFAIQFLGFAPDLVTIVTVFRGHVTDVAGEYQAYWKGRVISGSAAGAELTLECESVFTSMRRTGLRARFQRSCRHVLYSQACGVNMASYEVPATVLSSQPTSFVSNQAGLQADGYFTGGMVKLESGAMRFITQHIGSTLYISRPFLESIGGMSVSLYPGCDHLQSTCTGKFENTLNFGGFPYIPNINPFGGTSIV